MRKNIFITTLLFIYALFLGTANAQIDKRLNIVQQIVAAQGLTEMFDQQLELQKQSLQTEVSQLFNKILSDAGARPPNQKEQEALDRLSVRSREIFTGKEIVAVWASEYGKNLSDADLVGILNFYESKIGKSDVAASKSALNVLTVWMLDQYRAKSNALLETFMRDMQSANQK